jgi:peptidoglycan/LPS O-acetylase OafA/YrhL
MWGAGAALVFDEHLVRRFLTGHKASALGLTCLVGTILLSPLLEARYFSKYLFTVGYSLQGLAFATLILVVAVVPLSLIGRAFQFKPMVWLGQVSYSLYLWQQLFLVPTPLHQRPFNAVIGLGVSILIAVGSYLLVERPAIALGRRLTIRLRREGSRQEPGVSTSIAA